MILHTDFLYKYWGSNPIFLYKTAIFSASYGTQAPSKRRGNPNGDIYIYIYINTNIYIYDVLLYVYYLYIFMYVIGI